MKRKFLFVLLLSVCVLTLSLGFSACGKKHNHSWSADWDSNDTHHWHICTADDCPITDNSKKSGYAEHDFTNGNCICGKQKPIDFDDFIGERVNDAKNFVENFVRAEVVQEREVKSEYWSVSPTADNKGIDGVNILYVYAANGTARTVELANVTLTYTISINKIVNGEVTKSDVKMNVDRQTVFEFDAKFNNDNQDIINALYSSENKATDMKLIAETKAKFDSNNAYNYIVVSNGKIDTYKVEVRRGDGSKENVIENFQNGRKTEAVSIASFSINGTNIKSVAYQYETGL